MRNLRELGASPFPYIVSVLPRPLLDELVKGEHFVLVNLLELIPGGSSQADSAPKPFVYPNYLPSSTQYSKSAPQAKDKKKKKKKVGRVKATDEGF